MGYHEIEKLLPVHGDIREEIMNVFTKNGLSLQEVEYLCAIAHAGIVWYTELCGLAHDVKKHGLKRVQKKINKKKHVVSEVIAETIVQNSKTTRVYACLDITERVKTSYPSKRKFKIRGELQGIKRVRISTSKISENVTT